MGPTCHITLNVVDEEVLIQIDCILASISDTVERTRKGMVWDVRIKDRPIHVQVVDSERLIELAAGCKESVDYEVLNELADSLAESLGGKPSVASK